MRKNLEVDVPKDADTEVQRVRGLKKSIFTRTRIATLSLVLVLALSVSSTLAFEKWTGNQTPNRGNIGKVEVSIGERVGLDTAQTISQWDQDDEYNYGLGNKVVCFKAPNNVNVIDEELYVTIVPEFESDNFVDTGDNKLDNGFLMLDENWRNVKNETDESGNTHYYIAAGPIKIYLADDYQDNWTWVGGSFLYNETLSKGDTTADLVTGVVVSDDGDISKYKSVKVKIIAKGVNVGGQSS